MKNPGKYYVAASFNDQSYNAGIVLFDNEKILQANGFLALQFSHTKNGSGLIKLSRLANAVQMAFSIKKNSLVVFHFPLMAKAHLWLLQLLKWRGVKTVALIIDIDGIRDKDENVLQNELHMLKQFSCLIAHNPAMKNKLLHCLPSAKIYNINLFDYPGQHTISARQLSNNICFAGNISKATFVYSLHQVKGLQFNLYGSGYNEPLNDQSAVSYKGIIAPDQLPSKLAGSFGLVWDGGSIVYCDDYLRYNNPHKLSLYIAAGLPVIVWKDSAVAGFIEANNLGFTIGSLDEIANKIAGIGQAQYETMLQQVRLIGKEISEGKFLQKVMTAVLQDE